MSGGSYNYLFTKQAEDLVMLQGIGDLREMIETLSENGFLDVAKDSQSILFDVMKIQEELQNRLNKISDVWKAVEYWESGDWGFEDVKEEVEKYRKNK